MPQKLLDLVDSAAGIHHIAGETVPQGMGVHDVVQTRATRRRREQIVDRAELHRRAQRCPEQVDEQEVAVHRGLLDAFSDVLIVGLHDQPIHRDRPGLPRFRPCTIDVLPTDNVQMRAREFAPRR